MKQWARAVVYGVCGVVLLLAGASARAQETLTNADVVKMVQAHLSADVIVQQIENNPGHYVLTINSLIALKQAGVPDKVIAAMQAKRGARSEEKRAEEKPTAKEAEEKPAAKSGAGKDPYAWEVKDVVDRMTGKHKVEGYLFEKPEDASPGEELQGKATCDDFGMNLLVIYVSGTTPQTGYKQNAPAGPSTMGGLAGAFSNAVTHQRPWVLMQLKIDEGAPVPVSSESEYFNYVNVPFGRQTMRSAMNQIDHDQTKGDQGLANMLGAFASARGPATMQQIASAHTVLLELPRDNDSEMYFEIRPQDPTFQSLMSKCGVGSGPGGGGGIGRADMAKPTIPIRQREGKSYTGDVTGFAKVLPKMIDEAAAQWKFPPHSFDPEAQYIVALARLCASITPEIAAHYADQDPTRWHPGKDATYAACKRGFKGASMYVKNYDHDHERGLVAVLRPRGEWSEGKGIDLQVQFTGIPGDNVVGNFFDYYGIVDAELNVTPLPPGTDAGFPPRAPQLQAAQTSAPPPAQETSPAPAAPACVAAPAPAPVAQDQESPADDRVIVVTPAQPTGERSVTITAPGMNNHISNQLTIDARRFRNGGVVIVDITIPRNGRTAGSFDVFAGPGMPPGQGFPPHLIQGKHDVPPGTTVEIQQKFIFGQEFALNLEGNWFSPRGATSPVMVKVSVR